ncbi:MAG: Uma2 family endonuclease, partial [Chloroflexota bacterium]
YARNGVVEVWVADLAAGVLKVYRRPGAAGYGETQRFARGQGVTAGAFPDVTFLVEEAIGPA